MRIVILVAGNAMPHVAAHRGDFPRWIRERTGDAWPGRWATVDVRTEAPLPGPARRRRLRHHRVGGERDRARPVDAPRGAVRPRPRVGAPGGPAARHLLRAPDARAGPRRPRRAQPARARDRHGARAPRRGRPALRRAPRGLRRERHPRRLRREGPAARGGPRLDRARPRVRLPRRRPNVRAVQFHPEFDADIMRGYLRARAHLVRDEGGDPDALLAAVHDGTRGRDILQQLRRGCYVGVVRG